MKKYLVFGFWYPTRNGGFGDFVKACGTLDEAKTEAMKHYQFQIVDRETLKVVGEGYSQFLKPRADGKILKAYQF